MECRVLWWIFGGVAGVSPAEGVGENGTQSENFAFIGAEGETSPHPENEARGFSIRGKIFPAATVAMTGSVIHWGVP